MADALMLELPGPDGTRRVSLSSPDRLVWPQDGITKKDLANYVIDVGGPLLRAVGGRPVTLQRFPAGVGGEEFYQKNPPRPRPPWVRTVPCRYPSGREHDQIVMEEVATVAWAVQLGTVTFHPWPVQTQDTNNPDELRIDLDPQPGRTFTDAAEAALALRELLAEVGLNGWAKTSGNRGVHVHARITPEHEFLQVRHAVIAIARELERRLPDLVTTAWWKEERGERVFVDFNQACRDRTMASAYSPRPLPGAPVSMPVPWPQLLQTRPGDYTVRTVPAIVADQGDPWEGMTATAGDLRAALTLWEADIERGLGELNFPPDYPKMPGEPPRVPPSRRRAGKPDQDYAAPKEERVVQLREQWGMAILPPIAPMLAKTVTGFNAPEVSGHDIIFEPKWDGFRSVIARSGGLVDIGSRNEKPMTRYFPEIVEAVLTNFPDKAIIDGEIILQRPGEARLDFELLSQRIHPAASRVRRLAGETPAAFVAFDLLALGKESLLDLPFAQRRALLEQALEHAEAPIHLTPATRDVALAQRWFAEFEGAGLDGVIAKPSGAAYQQNRRTMFKIKHVRTADCVVAGYRTYRSGREAIGSLLLGLYAGSTLRFVGVVGALPMATRTSLYRELQALVTTAEDHPWNWAPAHAGQRTPHSSTGSRWAPGRDLSFTPLRPERVVEVRYDHMEGDRFRHTAQLLRWRADKLPADCTIDQLDEPVSYDLGAVLAAPGGAS